MFLKRSRWWLRKEQLSPCRSITSCMSQCSSPSSSCSLLLLSIFHAPLSLIIILISLTFSPLISSLPISIVFFCTTREACSLTATSDNWHSWGWTFRYSPIHMYSEQRDKSHLTHTTKPFPHMQWVTEELGDSQQLRTLLLPSNDSTFCPKEVVLCWNLIWFNVSFCNI